MNNVKKFIEVVRRSAEPAEQKLCDALEIALDVLEKEISWCPYEHNHEDTDECKIAECHLAREAQQKIEDILK